MRNGHTMPPADFLSTGDMCRLFGVTRQTIWRWRCERGLPAHEFRWGENGTMVLFKRRDVLRWARGHRIPVATNRVLEPA